MKKEAANFVEENKEKYALEMKKLLDIKCISMTHTGMDACSEFVCRMMKDAGILAAVYPTEGHPVVIGELKSSREGAPTLLVYGHYDTMPEGPLELWNSDPFNAEIRDGRIWGRGASDNKGQFFCHIKAQEVYRKFYGDLPVNVRYIFEGEEEIGSPHLPGAVEKYRDLLQADLAVCSDAGLHASGRPTLELGLKGLCALKLTCRTLSKPLHSQYAAAAPSASWRLIEALSTMKNAEGAVLVDGFYENVKTPDPAEVASIQDIPYDEEAQKAEWGTSHLLQNRQTDNYYYNYMFEPTCNVGCVSAGYVTGSKNVTVDEAVAYIDCRLVPEQTTTEIFEKVKAHLARRGFGDIAVEMYAHLPYTKTPLDCRYVPMMKEAMRDAYAEEPVTFAMLGCSAPFYVFSDILNIPWMMIPIGNADQNEHGANENMDLNCMVKGIKLGVALIEKMGLQKD